MSKLVCQNCGYENKNTMKFCINCGTKLEKETISVEKEETENRFCEECGHPVKPEEVFCENCGNRILKEEEIEEESTKEEAEEPELEEDSVEAETETEKSPEPEEQEVEDSKEDEKKICENCGKELKKTQDFCPACGTKFESKLEEKKEEPKKTKQEDSKDLEEVFKTEEESEFVFCIECGNQLNVNQEFCPKCGAKVMGLDQEEVVEDSMEKELPEESTKVDKIEGKVEEHEENQEVESEEEIEEKIEPEKEVETKEKIEEEPIPENDKEETSKKQEQAYCIECGKKLKKGQDFCVHCGAKVGGTVEEIVKPQEEKSNKKKILILLLLLLIAVCIVVCVIWKPWEKTTQKNEKKTEQKEVLVTVPSVVDKTQKEAIEILEDLSLKVKIEEVETEDSEKVGIVFEQEPMDKKVKKNSEVLIKVYISMEKVEMVPVVGENLEDATKKLEAIGVATKIIEQSSDTVEKGKVISQEVSEGENISKGSTVTITVSTGKEEKEEEKEPPKETNTPKNTPKPTSDPTPTVKSTPAPTVKTTPTPTSKPNWSSWTTSLPSNINSSRYEIETKTQYRSRNKETTTSTASSLSGWTRYDTKVEPIYSNSKTANVSAYDYNSFKKNTNNQIISEEVLNMDIIYLYCKNSNGTTAINKDKTCPSGYSMMAAKQFKQEGIDNSIVGTYITRENMSVLVSSVTPSDRKITYKEKTGDRYTYYYYRWGSWGSWQDNQIASNDSTEVSTRTMYRYRAK